MIPADKLLCTFFAGCAFVACISIATESLRAQPHADELKTCPDKPTERSQP